MAKYSDIVSDGGMDPRNKQAPAEQAGKEPPFCCADKDLENLLNATAAMLERPNQDSGTYWGAMLASVEAKLASPQPDRITTDNKTLAAPMKLSKQQMEAALALWQTRRAHTLGKGLTKHRPDP